MHILVVDDSKVMRGLIIRALRQAGYEQHTVAEAGNGIEALKSMRVQAPDLILLDWNMPEMSGIELAERLKGAGLTFRFGLVTSEVSLDMHRRASEAGAAFMLAKPFTAESLKAVLDQALGVA